MENRPSSGKFSIHLEKLYFSADNKDASLKALLARLLLFLLFLITRKLVMIKRNQNSAENERKLILYLSYLSNLVSLLLTVKFI